MMVSVDRYDPELCYSIDGVEPIAAYMQECFGGDYVQYLDYSELLKEYEALRNSVYELYRGM